MNERLKNLQQRLIDFWNKYDRKQKTIMVSVTLMVLVFVIILATVLTRPNYQVLVTTSSTTEAANVRDVLNSAGINFEVSNDGLEFSVRDSDISAANIELGANDIPATGYSLQDALSGGFTSTEADKEKMYKAYLEGRIKEILDQLDYVNSSTVTLEKPSEIYSVLESEEETSVSVTLDLKYEPGEDKIDGLANYLATAVGNSTTSKITIVDTQTNLLFLGEESDGEGGTSIRTQNDLLELRTEQVVSNIAKLFNSEYDDVNVSPFLDMNFDVTNTVSTEYNTGDEDNGPVTSEYIVNEEGSSGYGGVPGTDSNDEDVTTYEITDSTGSTSTYTLEQREYAVNETVTTTQGAIGAIDYDNSRVAIVLNKTVTYSEEEEQLRGSLDDMTWEEFQLANSDPVQITIDDQITEMVSFATGFDEANITIQAYEVPKFQDVVVDQDGFINYLAIILAVLIFGLLGFVVWRSLRPVEVTETEPELSVEALLSSTKEAQNVEEIDMNDKSEIRVAIEKFVDENPEAVALLLRNWLNEDWG